MSIPPYDWRACSVKEFGPVGRERHLVRLRQLTSACGASASVPGIWRRNTRKPKCEACRQVALRLGLE